MFIESEDRSSDLEILSVSVVSGIYPASESDRETNPGASLSSYKIVRKGDVVYNSMRMWQGAVDSSRYDGIVSPAYVVARPTAMAIPRFFARLLKRPELLRQYQRLSQGNSKDTQVLKFDEFAGIQVRVPLLLEEQEAIGAIADALDSLIALHQRKLDHVKELKKGLLQKMFPKEGANVPELRFPGFTDPWEQRKLGDIGKARSGVGFPDADQGGLTGVPFFKVSDMNSDGNENEMTVANNYVTAEQIADHRWSPITELPAIFFAKVGAAVMLNRKRLCRFPFLLDNNTMAYSLSPTKWDADFAKALFGTVDLTSLVQVGALPSYNAGDVESMEIYLPSLLEQEQIGAYFNHLDNLITLHQRELEKLQNIKKSMLEKMFV